MSARDQLRKYVAMASDVWTPRETTDARTAEVYDAIRAEVRKAEIDEAYRSGYRAGRVQAGAGGWDLNQFAAVFTTSDGSDCPVSELRHAACGGLVQGVGPHTLIDLMALAARHKCPTAGKDGC
ncbi:hypothetical protein [Streptomyces longwoodensis]|uniref:hypothetical protein n=1 Tax=Streptomyces longwoodensis TaxID=68231 RepID=UPI00324FBB03